jgi:sarcosine oxidase
MILPPESVDRVPDYYDRYAPRALSTPALNGVVRADVAIIGGGYTGLSAALHLAEQGTNVVVLEANQIGSGGSGRAFGQIAPYPRRDRKYISKMFGPDVGRRIIDAIAGVPALVLSLVKRHKMSCSAAQSGLIIAAYSPAKLQGLESNVRYWRDRGAPVSIHGKNETGQLIGTPIYFGCMLDRRGVTVNPLAYARELGRAAAEAGAILYQYCPAMTVHKDGLTWRVETREGSVVAERVIIATGAYTNGLWPGLARSILKLRGVQLVSERLDERLLKDILPGRQTLSDTNRLSTAVRVTEDGRLQTSAGGPFFDDRSSPDIEKAQQRISTLFPQVGRLRWEYGWSGWMDMSNDQLPHVYDLAPGVQTALGYTGRGIGIATLIGRDLAYRALGRPESALSFPSTKLRPLKYGPFSPILARGLLSFYAIADRFTQRM